MRRRRSRRKEIILSCSHWTNDDRRSKECR